MRVPDYKWIVHLWSGLRIISFEAGPPSPSTNETSIYKFRELDLRVVSEACTMRPSARVVEQVRQRHQRLPRCHAPRSLERTRPHGVGARRHQRARVQVVPLSEGRRACEIEGSRLRV